MEKYAYIRVSTKEQSIDRQLLALEPYQIKKKNIYCDYQSGQQVICGIVEKLQRMQLAKNREVKLTLVQDVEHRRNSGNRTSAYRATQCESCDLCGRRLHRRYLLQGL